LSSPWPTSSADERFEALLLALSEAGEGMMVIEDGHCVFANAAIEQITGYTFPELAAMESIYDLVVPPERDAAQERARQRMDEGLVEPHYGLTLRRRDGRVVRLEIGGVPLEVEGRRQLVVVGRDVTARERLHQRNAVLAEAGRLFDSVQEEASRISALARLVARELADVCVIALFDERGGLRQAAAAARDREPSNEELAAAERAALSVRSHGFRRVDGDLVAVALSARGRLHGALAVHADDAQDPDAVALYEELGWRAALALDNARLWDELSRVARSLQQSLLPPTLLQVPGVELAARYISAADGIVGGDFYDAFATVDGGWAVVVGDVCGKGAEAAAVTALARHTLRAAALHTSFPEDVLLALNEAILRAELDYRFCTVAYLALAPADGGMEATIATGGHPLPILVRADGRVASFGRPGGLLGVMEAPPIGQAVVTLGPGDMLVLYTDGVIEASRSGDAFGADRLAALLAGCAGRDAPSVTAAVEAEVVRVQHGRVRDDVAVLVARVPVADRFPAQPAGVAALA
jgi:PAS domain S-box-containing protein